MSAITGAESRAKSKRVSGLFMEISCFSWFSKKHACVIPINCRIQTEVRTFLVINFIFTRNYCPCAMVGDNLRESFKYRGLYG